MLKGLSKTTAIIAAAASMISVVPAYASTSAKTMDGTIISASAYKGSYVYEGKKAGMDSESVYVSDGDSDTEITDAKYYTFNFDERYGDKYMVANEVRDQKLDLSSGQVDKKQDLKDIEESLKSQLEEEFMNIERYRSDYKPVLKRVDKNRFGEPLYKYSTEKYTGFTDEDGNYIDASYLANISVVSKDERFITIGEYNRDYSGLTAKFISTDVLAQDDSYIYALTKLFIAGDEAPSDSNLTFIQKISKKQKKSDDNVYIPDSVESYEVTDKYKCDGADMVNSLLNGGAKVIVNNGNLYTIQKTYLTEIMIAKLNLGNEQAELDSIPGKSFNVALAEKDRTVTHEITPGSTYTIDVNNNVWGINNGHIFKVDGIDVYDMYECDSALNKLNVYDDNNLIAWNEDSGKYCSVINGKAE